MDNTITCKICGFVGKSLTTHVKHKHQIDGATYKNQYGGSLSIMSDKQKKVLSDINKEKAKNPVYLKMMSEVQKNGGSIFTKKYWMNKGLSEEEAFLKVKQIQSKNAKKSTDKGDWKNRSWMFVNYWIKKGYSESAAHKIISKKQSTLSNKSSKFRGHIRTEESKKKISYSMKKHIDRVGSGQWGSHFGKFNGRSKAEVEFYKYIKENITSKAEASVPISDYIVDICIGKKVIEFYGDFWHANPKIYEKNECIKGFSYEPKTIKSIWDNDKNRIDNITRLGYDVLIIWESDWNKNKTDCLEKIKKHLL